MSRTPIVLIIDDEEDCCLLMGRFLKKNNFEVAIAHTINDGVELIKNKVPDYIFLDNNLPDGLGWSIANHLSLNYPDTGITLISAYEYDYGLTEGNFEIWEKPISMKNLQQFILNHTTKKDEKAQYSNS